MPAVKTKKSPARKRSVAKRNFITRTGRNNGLKGSVSEGADQSKGVNERNDGKGGKSFNAFKEYKGAAYTGMAVGRSHKWNYDKGEWRETKITPDMWELTYDVVKRRAGHAPEDSGAPVGTGYHWFILSHQYVEKLNANDYATSMSGLKFKLAHKRATKTTWSASDAAQRKALIKLLQDFIADLQSEPQMATPVPLHFQYRGKDYEGVGIPMLSSCHDGICDRLDVTLNKKHLGVIKCTKNGWRLTNTPQGLANAIGTEVFKWYE